MPRIGVWPKEPIVYAQPTICPGKWDSQTPLGFWDTSGSPNLAQTTLSYNNYKKERTRRIVDFVVPADHWVDLKECRKMEKYLDLARNRKKLWNMKVTIIPIVIGILGTVTKGLVRGLKLLEITDRVETVQITALMKVLETWGDLLSLKLQWNTIT